MSNESLEGFIQSKIQALKSQRNEIDEKINRVAAGLLVEKQAVDKEISKLQSLIKDFKSGVNPLETKVNIAKGGRRKKPTV